MELSSEDIELLLDAIEVAMDLFSDEPETLSGFAALAEKLIRGYSITPGELNNLCICLDMIIDSSKAKLSNPLLSSSAREKPSAILRDAVPLLERLDLALPPGTRNWTDWRD